MDILLIDDDDNFLAAMSMFLKCDVANNSGDGLKAVKNKHYDLLILDYFMRNSQDGDKIAEEIRKFNKKLPIVLLTGNKDEVSEDIKDRLGIIKVIQKGSGSEELLKTIIGTIKHYSENQELTFHTRLKELRNTYGLSQQDVADALNIKRAAYNTYELSSEPNQETLKKLAQFFKVSVDYLICYDPLKKYI